MSALCCLSACSGSLDCTTNGLHSRTFNRASGLRLVLLLDMCAVIRNGEIVCYFHVLFLHHCHCVGQNKGTVCLIKVHPFYFCDKSATCQLILIMFGKSVGKVNLQKELCGMLIYLVVKKKLILLCLHSGGTKLLFCCNCVEYWQI